jgi:hypothetical protein
MEIGIERVVFVLFNTHDFGVYKTLLESMIEKYGAKIL